MDTREKFNIKQMVDCERQEPFYPVTHASAIKVIDNEGHLRTLQDIINILLEAGDKIININFNDLLENLLEIGCSSDDAFQGDLGCEMYNNMYSNWDKVYPVSQEVQDDDSKPVSGKAVYNFINQYIQSFSPVGVVATEGTTNSDKAVKGYVVYNYLWNDFLKGVIGDSNTEFSNYPVTGKTVFDALKAFTPDGVINDDSNNNLIYHAVSGYTVWQALQGLKEEIEGDLGDDIAAASLWEVGDTTSSIRQKNDQGLQTTNSNEVAIGKYNKSTSDQTIFSIGVGTGPENNNRKNAIEIRKDLAKSVVVPFGSGTVSIQEHMGNQQPNILHLSQDLMDKLQDLIDDKWHATKSFSATELSSKFYTNNQGIKFSWSIKNSEGNDDTNVDLNICKGTSNESIYHTTSASGTYNLTNYNNYSFSASGKTTITHTLKGRSASYPEANGISIQGAVTLYAPCYLFCSAQDDIYNLNNMSSSSKTINIQSLSSFNSTITIPSGSNMYIYIALPTHLGDSISSVSNSPFKVAGDGGGYSLSLSSSYDIQNTTKSFTVCQKENISTNYKLFRSALTLNPGEWNITT